MITALFKLFILAYLQNVSFTFVSRSRNRNHMGYFLIASIFSHSLWFFTFKELVKGDMDLILFIPYLVGTILGSMTGMKTSMRIEKWLNASSDDHLKKEH